ncbi:hypothetical protein [Chamaesiphon minutus]|uniref:Uncharacterized protein n=1 Tax=Chamaesiphon minutus (strain ATCC 27169 / PCC 6605) TaxID=1173020 RepID=K9UQX3_CHAP6|nr:hypothetical protein [Chamaesiphon minutus]AFY96649.1 hypothetical protein Cha6605_5794 [Chamaesiphon minutus PCC 6605]
MLGLSQTLERWEYLWRKQNVTYWAFGWSALSLFTYIFFSGPAQGIERPFWYRIFTAYILQNVPTIFAGLLCIRNGVSRRMPSGSQVWLLFGTALLAYSVGNIFFSSWELVWQLNSTGSLGDPFFVIFYICLLLAMFAAIVNKRVRLNIYQWAIVLGISIYAATILLWILKPPADSSNTVVEAISTPASQVQTTAVTSAATPAPALAAPAVEPTPDAPGWVMFFDGILKPYGQTLNAFYVWCDIALFAMAIVMILAFWGGRLSNAWQFIAQGITCYYIADMWFAYAGNQIPDYQGGFMLEVFWILGAIQFGVAAGIEFEHMQARKQGDEDWIYDDVG